MVSGTLLFAGCSADCGSSAADFPSASRLRFFALFFFFSSGALEVDGVGAGLAVVPFLLAAKMSSISEAGMGGGVRWRAKRDGGKD